MYEKTTVNKKKQNAANGLYSFISTFIYCMMFIFILFTFFFRPVSVSGVSMIPTLFPEDKIIISNFLYTPNYGDIIVIGKANAEEDSLIKRVIALPNDEININFETHIITVNGKVITENYEVTEGISKKGDFSYPLTVPEDCVFVLGDNRNNSLDSRFQEIGFISIQEITGKALIRIFPLGKLNLY